MMNTKTQLRLASEMMSVIGLSAFGAVMFAIASTLLNYWKSVPATEFANIFAQQDANIMSMISVVVAPTILSLTVTVIFNWKHVVLRNIWLASTGAFVLILVITVTYFVPNNTAFAEGGVAVNEVAARLDQWGKIHWTRIALAALSAVLGGYAIIKGRSIT